MKQLRFFAFAVLLSGHTRAYAAAPPPPQIFDISPVYAWEGETVTISGSDFSAVVGNNLVLFDSLPGDILSASTSQIQVKVPQGAHFGPLRVAVTGVFSNEVVFKASLPFVFQNLSTMGVDETTGSLWVTDQGSANAVSKLTIQAGTRLVFSDQRTSLNQPNGLPHDAMTRFYVMASQPTSANQGTIYRVGNTGGREVVRAAGVATTDPVWSRGLTLHDPSDVGNPAVFILEQREGKVRRVPQFGSINRNYATGLNFNDPGGIAWDSSAGLLYVTSLGSLRRVFSGGGGSTAVTTGLNLPTGLFFDDGKIFIAAKGSGTIHQYDIASDQTTVLVEGLDAPRAVVKSQDLGQDVLWIAERQRIVKANFRLQVSNIAFFPGYMGSRIYDDVFVPLWIGLNKPSRCRLRADEQGAIPGDQFAIDVIETVPLGLPLPFNLSQDVYGDWKTALNMFKNSGLIADWDWWGYDWRESVRTLAFVGTSRPIGTSNPITMIEALAATSNTGKVTLIGHSNGGLIIKEIILKLTQLGRLDLIDKLILVASPQLGTPTALGALLHGIERGIPHVMSDAVAREIGETQIGGYTLLPSPEYFNRVSTPVAIFPVNTPEAPLLTIMRSHYDPGGTGVISYGDNTSGMRGLILGLAEGRVEPYIGACVDADDPPEHLFRPNVGRVGVLQTARNLHDNDLDDWQVPTGIDAYQIAGNTRPTFKTLRYFSQINPNCTGTPCPLVPLPTSLHTPKGDGTVVLPSATAMSVETYYLDLDNSNTQTGQNREHFNIMGTPILHELVEALIKGDPNPNLPSNLVSTIARNGISSTQISLSSPVNISVLDSTGRYTGEVPYPNPGPDVDPNLTFRIEQIPNSSYEVLGGHRSILLDTRETRAIHISGRELGVFGLQIDEYLDDDFIGGVKWVDVPAAPESRGSLSVRGVAEVTSIDFDVEGDGVVDYTIVSADDPQTLLWLEIFADIIRSRGLEIRVEEKLLDALDKAVREIQRGENVKAARKLNDFAREVDTQRDHDRIPADLASGLSRISYRLASPLVPRPAASPTSPISQ